MSFSRLPAGKAFLINPSNSNFLPPINEGATGVAVYVGVGGTIKIINSSNVEQTLTVSSGSMVGVLVKKVFSTGTSAGSLLGIYKITA